jgi:hypothetical protein
LYRPGDSRSPADFSRLEDIAMPPEAANLYWFDALDRMRPWAGSRRLATPLFHYYLASGELPYVLKGNTHSCRFICIEPGPDYLKEVLTAELLFDVACNPARISIVHVIAPGVSRASNIVRARRTGAPMPEAAVFDDPLVTFGIFVNDRRLDDLGRRGVPFVPESAPAAERTPEASQIAMALKEHKPKTQLLYDRIVRLLSSHLEDWDTMKPLKRHTCIHKHWGKKQGDEPGRKTIDRAVKDAVERKRLGLPLTGPLKDEH